MKKEYEIKKVGNGWYNFEAVPQGFIKIYNLCCGSDENAIKQAKKILPDAKFRVVE